MVQGLPSTDFFFFLCWVQPAQCPIADRNQPWILLDAPQKLVFSPNALSPTTLAQTACKHIFTSATCHTQWHPVELVFVDRSFELLTLHSSSFLICRPLWELVKMGRPALWGPPLWMLQFNVGKEQFPLSHGEPPLLLLRGAGEGWLPQSKARASVVSCFVFGYRI